MFVSFILYAIQMQDFDIGTAQNHSLARDVAATPQQGT